MKEPESITKLNPILRLIEALNKLVFFTFYLYATWAVVHYLYFYAFKGIPVNNFTQFHLNLSLSTFIPSLIIWATFKKIKGESFQYI